MPAKTMSKESAALIKDMKEQGRIISKAVSGDEQLGPLKDLPGVWSNKPTLEGQGFNMIALPSQGAIGHGKVKKPGQEEMVMGEETINYRLLVNKYNEELKFDFVDKGVPNRGLDLKDGCTPPDDADPDQVVVALDYQQVIHQIAVEDFPKSGKEGKIDAAIHHEPGLWLYMRDEKTYGVDLARLATVPHGDSVLALGKSKEEIITADIEVEPDSEKRADKRQPLLIPDAVQGLPVGYPMALDEAYMQPYRHFSDCHFHGFDPRSPQNLLQAVRGNWERDGIKIIRANVIEVDSTLETGGIKNIPFIVKQANASSMKSTFWIMEIDDHGKRRLILQYLQVVMLDFFPREDGLPGLVQWPHVSINTLEKICTQ